MVFILFIFILFCVCCSPLQANPLHQVGDDLFYSSRTSSSNLYFVMEKVTAETSPIWLNFYKREYEIMEALDDCFIHNGCAQNLEMALDGFGNMVDNMFLNTENTSSQIWVAYALQARMPPESKINPDRFPFIEMALTSSTNPDAPFFMHMGIFRTVSHVTDIRESSLQAVLKPFVDSLKQDHEPDSEDNIHEILPLYHLADEIEQMYEPLHQTVRHAHLSVPLHCFAATVLQTLYPTKRYMITKPLPNMTGILFKALNPGSIWCVDAYKAVLDEYYHPSVDSFCPLQITGSIRRLFYADWGENIEATANLKDQEGKNLWTLKSTEKNRIEEKYKWFFDNDFFLGAGGDLVIIDASAMKEKWHS